MTTKRQVVECIHKKMSAIAGNACDATQLIEMRFNELIGGVRNDMAVKIYGDDLDQLAATGQRIAALLRKIPGMVDTRAAQTSGFPTLDIEFDRAVIARHGLTLREVVDTVPAALAGRPSDQIFEGDRRFDLVVRLSGDQRNSLDQLRRLPATLPTIGGKPRASVPLGSLMQLEFMRGLNEVSRDNGKRRLYVEANVSGRDLGSLIVEAQKCIDAEIKLPAGAWTKWGGQFQNLQVASKRLTIIIPACLVLISAVPYLAIGSAALMATALATIPMAVAGDVFTLAIRGIPSSISAAVGFIAVSDMAVLNGLVMILVIRKRLEDGMATSAAVTEGVIERMRPALTTALVASSDFISMTLGTDTGAEVQRPLVTVVIGGLITVTVLTLLVLPALCGFALKRSDQVRPESELEPLPQA